MQAASNNMIKQQLRTGNVLNEKVLQLFENLPRERFVPKNFEGFAYSDMQIPLDHGQSMMTPLEEGLMLQALELTGTETVLEVGTGTGFFTALLSRLSRQVLSVDYHETFTQHASQRLSEFNCTNVECVTGDACQGWVEKAPYDVIVLTGAIEILTDIQRLQLMPGGRLIAIVGRAPAMQGRLYQLDHQGEWSEKVLFETCIPSLIDKLSQNRFVF